MDAEVGLCRGLLFDEDLGCGVVGTFVDEDPCGTASDDLDFLDTTVVVGMGGNSKSRST